MAEVCVLPDRFIPSSKGTDILSMYIILPGFIEIGQELFEIIWVQTLTHTQTDTQTHRHIHAVENNTCPKTKSIGLVMKSCCLFTCFLSNVKTAMFIVRFSNCIFTYVIYSSIKNTRFSYVNDISMI